MFKAVILHLIDLDNSKLEHKSISGGKATHSLNQIMTLEDSTLEGLKVKIQKQFGQTYDIYENSMYLTIPETEWAEQECPENYEAIITQVSEGPVMLDSLEIE
jgi:hypothetical protein